ncbi:MAG: hypothetical protein ABSA47_20165 [Verrucomicrobiota bacterium]|jgi:hypothetical protein
MSHFTDIKTQIKDIVGSAIDLQSGRRRLLPFVTGGLSALGKGGAALKAIPIHRLALQFDAGQITHGRAEEQADQASYGQDLSLEI